MLNTLRRTLPWLFYEGLLHKSIEDKPRVLLDVGCGKGEAFKHLRKIDNGKKLSATYCVGFDVFKEYLPLAKMVYNDVVRCDVRKLPLRAECGDLILCLDLIEHLGKREGLNLLKNIERITKKQVIVFTPVGWLPQEEWDNNPWQKHQSEWFPQEFQKWGFQVYGISGFGGIYGLKCEYRIKNAVLRPFFHLLRLFSQFLAFKKTHIAYQVLCVKNKWWTPKK